MPGLIDPMQAARYQALGRLVDDLRLPPGRFLDIGSDLGDICQMMHGLGHETVGLEVQDHVLKEARDKYPHLRFENANCEEELPFEDASFDLAWSGDVIEHIRATDVFVNEANRVLRVGGHFIVTTPMHNRIKGALVALVNFERHYDPEFPHYRFYTPKSLRRVLEARGFRVIKLQYLGRPYPISQSMLVVARKESDRQVKSEFAF